MTAPRQPLLPTTRIPDHLRVTGPYTLPDGDARARADREARERAEAVRRQVAQREHERGRR